MPIIFPRQIAYGRGFMSPFVTTEKIREPYHTIVSTGGNVWKRGQPVTIGENIWRRGRPVSLGEKLSFHAKTKAEKEANQQEALNTIERNVSGNGFRRTE